MPDLLVVLEGIHQTLSVEGKLKARGLNAVLVPTPPAVSLGCGFSILIPGGGRSPLPGWWEEMNARRAAYRIVVKERSKAYEEIDRRERTGLSQAGDHEQEGDRGGGSG